MKISLGICAYNEEKNIGDLLYRLRCEPTLSEVIVVASGCTDNTVPIVQAHPWVKLIVQNKREGKASAINEFLKVAVGNVLILESADTIPGPKCIRHLVSPLGDPAVGMVGCHPIPLNSRRPLSGFTVHLLWGLHHSISLENPKMGEMIAFRNVVKEIDPNTAVDEAYIEKIIKSKGYKLFYSDEAIVWNRGPETVKELVRQRRRINLGHMILARQGHDVATSNVFTIAKHVFKVINFSPRDIFYTLPAISIEAFSKFLALYDLYSGKSHTIWEVSDSTKCLK